MTAKISFADNLKRNGMDKDEINAGQLSDCCNAIIKYHDICDNCGEHCDPMEIIIDIKGVKEV